MISLIHFKTPNRIDWKKTNEAIAKRVNEAYADARSSEKAMIAASFLQDCKKYVRKYGVRELYDAKLRLLKERANQKEVDDKEANDKEEEQNKMYYMIGGIEPGQKGAENASE